MKNNRLYKVGELLAEDEFLLKTVTTSYGKYKFFKGFLTKLTQKNEVPKSLLNWHTKDPITHNPVEIFIVKETFKSGWKINDYRPGQSQNWAELIHPDGYTIEIYLDDFFKIIKENNVLGGEIIGKFKWNNHKLIKE